MTQFIAEGTYRDLLKYFNNGEYPGLKEAFPENYIKNNMLGTTGVYGIPFAQSYGIVPFIYLRGDLREKYGCEPVTTPETYRAFLDAVKENDPSMVPYAASISNYNVASICLNENWLKVDEMRRSGVWDGINIGGGLPQLYVFIDGYEVKEAAFIIEPEAAFANFPAPYNTKMGVPWTWYGQMAREFQEKGWTERDFMTATDTPAMFYSGKAASLYWDTANYSAIINSLISAVPEAKVEVYQLNPVYQQGLKGMVTGQYAASNFLCIPVTTPEDKTDRIMMFYNWMFSSWDNHDLFELGVAGVNFELVGDRYRIPDGVDAGSNYNFPPYQLTWNPNFIRISADFPDNVVKTIEMQNDPETFYEPLWSGFSFQRESVTTQMTNPDIATIGAEFSQILYGQVADIPGKLAELEAQYSDNKNLTEDIATIKAEYISQLQAHLDKKKAG
jgi:putative aldouronate transport system substrate-binding protein